MQKIIGTHPSGFFTTIFKSKTKTELLARNLVIAGRNLIIRHVKLPVYYLFCFHFSCFKKSLLMKK